LHADRGAPQRAKPVAFLLADLGITRTHSRPYTSSENPYSESNFKTLKYRPEFPARFDDIDHARTHCRAFVDWYNHAHRHSGIGLMTPSAVHHGHAKRLHAARGIELHAAYERHPERFVRRPPVPPELPTAAWINKPDTKEVAAAHYFRARSVSPSLTGSDDALDYTGGVVLVLGSEGRGLRPRVAGACDALVSLPMRGRIESLSVSAAAAVLLYEAARRRR